MRDAIGSIEKAHTKANDTREDVVAICIVPSASQVEERGMHVSILRRRLLKTDDLHEVTVPRRYERTRTATMHKIGTGCVPAGTTK